MWIYSAMPRRAMPEGVAVWPVVGGMEKKIKRVLPGKLPVHDQLNSKPANVHPLRITGHSEVRCVTKNPELRPLRFRTFTGDRRYERGRGIQARGAFLHRPARVGPVSWVLP